VRERKACEEAHNTHTTKKNSDTTTTYNGGTWRAHVKVESKHLNSI